MQAAIDFLLPRPASRNSPTTFPTYANVKSTAAIERVRWTDEEDHFILTQGALSRDWEAIAAHLTSKGQVRRTADAVRNHFHRLVKQKGDPQKGTGDSQRLGLDDGESGKQKLIQLQPIARQQPDCCKWSREEDECVLRGVEELGKCWRAIARRLPPNADTSSGELPPLATGGAAVTPESSTTSSPETVPQPSPPAPMAMPLPPSMSAPTPRAAAVPPRAPPAASLTRDRSRSQVSSGEPAEGTEREYVRAAGRARYDLLDRKESDRIRSWNVADLLDDDAWLDLCPALLNSLTVHAPAEALVQPPTAAEAERFANDVLESMLETADGDTPSR